MYVVSACPFGWCCLAIKFYGVIAGHRGVWLCVGLANSKRLEQQPNYDEHSLMQLIHCMCARVCMSTCVSVCAYYHSQSLFYSLLFRGHSIGSGMIRRQHTGVHTDRGGRRLLLLPVPRGRVPPPRTSSSLPRLVEGTSVSFSLLLLLFSIRLLL